MSAYMVCKEHIDLLVSVAECGPRGGSRNWFRPYLGTNNDWTSDSLGEALVKENLSSIHARYPDTVANPDETPGPCEQYWLREYAHTEHYYRLTPIEALKALDCYVYQSCEHAEWQDSAVREFCDRLRAQLTGLLPGYEAATWEWTAERLQTTRRN